MVSDFPGEKTIIWAQEEWKLLPGRAVYRARSKTIVVTDPHFGKDASFRWHGIAVPKGTTESDLLRLSSLLDRFVPERLLLLGDFFHAKTSQTEETLASLTAWRRGYSTLEIVNIAGNHDRHAGDPPNSLSITAVKESLLADGILFSHFPTLLSGVDVVSGHLHPAVSLKFPGGAVTRLPCFWVAEKLMVIPAFGSFTGMGKIHPKRKDRIYAIAGEEVIEIAPSSSSLTDEL